MSIVLRGLSWDDPRGYGPLAAADQAFAASTERLVDSARRAKEHGYRAGKMEVCIKGPYSHHGIQASDAAVVEIVAACRKAVGPDFVMMADLAYCWSNARSCCPKA